MLGENDKSADAYEHARNLRPADQSIAVAEAEALLDGRKAQDPLSDRLLTLLKSWDLTRRSMAASTRRGRIGIISSS